MLAERDIEMRKTGISRSSETPKDKRKSNHEGVDIDTSASSHA